MKQPSIDDLLNDLQTTSPPAANDSARTNAIAQANFAFEQASSTSTPHTSDSFFNQGSAQTHRPKTQSTDSFFRSIIMSLFSKQPLGAGFSYTFGALAIIGISIPILLSYQSGPTPTSIAQPNPASEFSPSVAALDKAQSGNDKVSSDKVSSDKVSSDKADNQQVSNKGQQTAADTLKEVAIGTVKQQSESDGQAQADTSRQNTPITPEKSQPVEQEARLENKKPRPTASSEPQSLGRNSLVDNNNPSLAQTGPAVRSVAISGARSKQIAADADLSGVINPAPSNQPRHIPTRLPTYPPAYDPKPDPTHKHRPDVAEEYAEYIKSSIIQVSEQPISTFSADVDTASYSLTRNQLNQGLLPAQQAVRPEEFINYFNYDYPLSAAAEQPFNPTLSVMDSPWNKGRKLVHIGIKGYDLALNETPSSNIVFLIDVSGSMSAANKLPLAKQSVSFLLQQLKPTDTVSIAVYAGAAGAVLEPTSVKEKGKIMAALNQLNAGGSTAGGAGIELAYSLVQQHFNKEAVNRIILLTDGDFNVGQSSNQALLELVERKRNSGVYLSVLGFGRHNYQDDMMQTLAHHGNGIATFIDTVHEAKKVMVDEATSALFPIAKDVKFQVEFNPSRVSDYRLIGYETRALETADFNNDKVDAGDIGAGHTVTAIYEITPIDSAYPTSDKPRYDANQRRIASSNIDDSNDNFSASNEYGYLKIRYKLPDQTTSQLIETAITHALPEPSQDAKFSIAVAGFAQLLSGSKHTGALTYGDVASFAKRHKGPDLYGYRAEFIRLVEMANLIE